MKDLAIALLTIGLALTVKAQDNPYEIFGYESKIDYEINDSELLKVINADTSSVYKTLVFDYKNLIVILLDKNDSILDRITIKPYSTLRFISIDPHAENYPQLSPYNFVENMPSRAVDPDGQDIYVLFYTTGNDHGDAMFKAAAQTRMDNIQNSQFFDPANDKVVMIQLTDMSEIQTQMNDVVTQYSEQYGQTREVGVWSHAGWDGPIGTEETSSNGLHEGSPQMSMEGWSQIDFNWTENGASCTFYGCNTGNDLGYNKTEWVGSFSRDISRQKNFKDVQVAGQSSSAFPSFSPFVRSTNVARSYYPGIGFSFGETYMVGGNKGEGGQSLWFMPGEYPRANPLNVYENGQKVGSGLQSTGPANPIIR